MLIAEIRRKLGDLEELDLEGSDPEEALRSFLSSRKEDILTADVFGTLKYLPRKPYLAHLLRGLASRNPHAVPFAHCLQQQSFGDHDFEFRFWPSYLTPGGVDGQRTEPDVEIVSNGIRIFVEAKLHSGFGDLQIVRQLLIGLADPKSNREFFLLLVTKGFHAPRIPFENKKHELPEYLKRIAPTLAIPHSQQEQLASAHDRILWINWRTLALLMQECRRIQPAGIHSRGHDDMLEDLKQLLMLRSLAPFHGISSSIPTLLNGRPVIANFLTGKVTKNRQAFCFTSIAKRSLDSTTSFRSPARREKGRFKLQQAVARGESPSVNAWKFQPKDRPGDRLALHRLIASKGDISRTPQLWALSPYRQRFSFSRAVRQFHYSPTGPLLLRSQNE